MAGFTPTKIIVHHSLTKDSGTVSWGAIRRYHMQTLGFRAIGYHAGVELVTGGGESYYEMLMGRMWDKIGAHTRGQNSKALGICFVGNYDRLAAHDQMIKIGAELIALWLRLFDLTVDCIYPHTQFAPYKTCPGSQFDMEYLKTCVRRGS